MQLLHRFKQDISDVELPLRFNNPFYYSPHRLCMIAADEVRANMLSGEAVAAEAAKGKMFGVLVVRDKEGSIGYLAAFSGLFMGCNNVEGFVPPVFDLQNPDGYFKREEAEISAINAKIKGLEASAEYISAKDALDAVRHAADEAMAGMRAGFAANKARRAQLRAGGTLTADDEATLIKASQFEKAELKRAQRAWQAKVLEKETLLKIFTDKKACYVAERRSRSAALQQWLFRQFVMLDGRGRERTLLDIFKEHRGCIPPAGAGECAGPKLMQYAYANSLHPLALAEFWVGESPVGEVRRDGCFYGACKSKCEPILTYMLQGLDVEENALEHGGDINALEVVYEDEWLVAVNKPSGVLSVPGIVGGTSVQQWLREEYLRCNELFVVHRLDMATSGVLVAAKSMEVYKAMQALFASRDVKKEYIALLDGVPSANSGTISLPLAADYDARPRQKVDYRNGKEAVTRYDILDVVGYDGKQCALVRFEPLTGRTHQLRVHSAYKDGLDVPIVGDALYGRLADRLMLHAASLEFRHPMTGEKVSITAKVPF
ncbi:MAG: RluA family pseudouridine synthase [Bacteroidales bacterium]|nr:RluA family pseudouridine synthase [Bacteroidales bacterium]